VTEPQQPTDVELGPVTRAIERVEEQITQLRHFETQRVPELRSMIMAVLQGVVGKLEEHGYVARVEREKLTWKLLIETPRDDFEAGFVAVTVDPTGKQVRVWAMDGRGEQAQTGPVLADVLTQEVLIGHVGDVLPRAIGLPQELMRRFGA
jgi:hypothetical protein